VASRSESSLSHGASDSTSATNELAMSSLSSIVQGPTGTAAGYTQRRHSTRLDEMIEAETGRPVDAAAKQWHTTYRKTTTSDDTAQCKSAHPPASLLPEPVRQSALKRQSYLYKLVSDADRHDSRRGGHDSASATNSDVSSGADYKPLRQWQQRSNDEYFPPPPTAEELHPSHHRDTASVTRQAASEAGTSRLYKSPFLLATGGPQSTTVKSFDYKEFHRSGSVTAPKSSSKTGSLSPARAARGDDRFPVSSTGGGGYTAPVSGSGEHQRAAGSGSDSPRVSTATSGGAARSLSVGDGSGSQHASIVSARPYSAVSGVKPASHHQPSRHTYVVTLNTSS